MKNNPQSTKRVRSEMYANDLKDILKYCSNSTLQMFKDEKITGCGNAIVNRKYIV